MKANYITVLKVEVGKAPYLKKIKDDIKVLQQEVGGLIEAVSVGHDCVAIINDNGKVEGLKPNRWIGNDIICGDFFICGDGYEDLCSLNKKQISFFEEEFKGIPKFNGTESQLKPRMIVWKF